jgi:hypothetical protein
MAPPFFNVNRELYPILLFMLYCCYTFDAIKIGQSTNNDDIVGGYSGFNDVSEMPLPRSDMTATFYHANETFGQARIYLFGGCIADQIW